MNRPAQNTLHLRGCGGHLAEKPSTVRQAALASLRFRSGTREQNAPSLPELLWEKSEYSRFLRMRASARNFSPLRLLREPCRPAKADHPKPRVAPRLHCRDQARSGVHSTPFRIVFLSEGVRSHTYERT